MKLIKSPNIVKPKQMVEIKELEEIPTLYKNNTKLFQYDAKEVRFHLSCFACGIKKEIVISYKLVIEGVVKNCDFCKECKFEYLKYQRFVESNGTYKEVYIVTHPNYKNWIKVGISINSVKRLEGYQTSTPHRDYVLYYHTKLVCNPTRYESFFKKYVKGNGKEWFNISPENGRQIIEKLNKYFEKFSIGRSKYQEIAVQIKETGLIGDNNMTNEFKALALIK